jgi:predicted NBD/HSP70 family sugar kinase
MTVTREREVLGSASGLGFHNRRWIVGTVGRRPGISRVELARLSGLSKGAVTVIVQQLARRGILVDQPTGSPAGMPNGSIDGDGTRANGRSGGALSLNPAYASAVGVELTDGRADAIVVDLSGETRAAASQPFASDAAPAEIIGAAARAIREVMPAAGAAGSPGGHLRGVGVAVPGLVDAEAGVSLWIPGLLRWRDVPVSDLLARELGVPVVLDWRAYTATLAEQWYGHGRHADDFLYINVGDGVGMGIVIGGRLVRGSSSMAGLLGHVRMSAAEGAETCVCGNDGCLQTRVAVPAIIHRAQRAITEGVFSVVTAPGETGAAHLRFEDLIAAARSGDRLTGKLLEEAGDWLGIAVADLLHVLNPPLVIIGGGIVRAGDLVMEPLVRAARRRALPRAFAATRIVQSELRPGAAILGAGALVLRRALDEDLARLMAGAREDESDVETERSASATGAATDASVRPAAGIALRSLVSGGA